MARKTDKGVSKRTEYHQVVDGEWIQVPKRGFKEQCCDCGLIHRLNFKIDEKGNIHIQTFRDGRATNGARRAFQFTKEEE